MKLKGKVALITGASRGIGRAIGRRFAEEGASIVANYAKNRVAAEELCKEIQAAGGRAISLEADVADAPQVNRMVEAALREFERIDILVNNAGILKTSTLLDATLTDLDRMIDVNFKGVMHCVRAVAGEMMKRKEGKILNLSSIGAMGTAFPGTTVYAATKGAIIALTKRLAFELGPYNINVNALAPGFIRSDMTLQDGDLSLIQGKVDLVAGRAMLGRIGEPQDVAGAAVFLVSPDAAFITAQTLAVDGGRMDVFSHSAQGRVSYVRCAVAEIYGVVAQLVALRTREFGIRMAPGADSARVLAMVMRRGAIIVSIGLIIGIGGAAILTDVLGSIHYGVTGTDPATFASMAVLLGLMALAACLIPAIRASRVDPATPLPLSYKLPGHGPRLLR